MNSLFIVDGQKAVSQMLAEALESRSFLVKGFADTVEKAFEEIVAAKPQLVVTEMNLPDGAASELIDRLNDALPGTRFLIFSDNKEALNVRASLQAGAHGFVEKSVNFDMFLNALNIVTEGGCFFGFNITEVLRTVVANEKPKSEERFDNLTERESEVLKLIALGNSNKDIAAKLGLSVKTIDNHRCSMMRKLDLHNVADITRYAVEHRYVEIRFAR